MPTHIIHGFEGIRALVGVSIPPTDWFAVEQQRVDAFAECTGDFQWIHVDVERARASRLGGTIAHGYLTLALIPMLWHRHVDVQGTGEVLNVGLDRVRFPAPLRIGSRIRASFAIVETKQGERGLRVVNRVTIEAKDAVKPVCVADLIVLYRPAVA
jgi:acyl dehydratase